MEPYSYPFKKFQFFRQWYNRKMCYIYAFNFPAPEPESIITYDDINFIVADDPFYSQMLSQNMKTKKRCFKEEGKILR